LVLVTLQISHGSWISAIGEAPRCAVESSGENRGGGSCFWASNSDARDAMPSNGVRQPCFDDASSAEANASGHLTMSPARLANYTCAQSWAPLESHRFRGVDGGTCLAVAHWGAESALGMGGIKNLHPVTRHAAVVCQAGARAKFSSRLELCNPLSQACTSANFGTNCSMPFPTLRPSSRARIRSLQIERVAFPRPLSR
jgi:hypothetical protein